jgi:hypothetical protein
VLTGRTVSVEAKRNLVERSRPRPRVPRATEGAVEYTIHSPQKMGTGVDGTYLLAVAPLAVAVDQGFSAGIGRWGGWAREHR